MLRNKGDKEVKDGRKKWIHLRRKENWVGMFINRGSLQVWSQNVQQMKRKLNILHRNVYQKYGIKETKLREGWGKETKQ